MLYYPWYFTYIVQCKDGTYYVGKATDIKKRILQHNGKLPGGAKYTRGRRPVTLKYFEKYPTVSAALIREIEIKKLTRKEKEKLVRFFKEM